MTEQLNRFIRDIVLLIAVGAACFFIGSNQGLRSRDLNTITILRQRNTKLVQVVNYASKADTTKGVIKLIKALGLN